MKTFQVVDWDPTFENSRSRSVKDLSWVGMPNKHDGEGFSLVMAHPRAAEIFAAWVLIVQVASRCKERGVLAKDNGVPYTAQSLATKTRSKAEWFEIALEFLSSPDVGWLKAVENDVEAACSVPSPAYQDTDAKVTADHQRAVTIPSPDCQETDCVPSPAYHPGDTLPSPAHHPTDGEVSADHQEGDSILTLGYQETVTTRKEDKEGREGQGDTTSLRSVGGLPPPPPQRARSEPFDSIKDVLVEIAECLELPAPNDSEVRPHLRKDAPLRHLVEKLGVKVTAELYVWVARHIPKGLSWPQIWSNHASLVSQMRSGVDPIPKSGSGSLQSHMDRINAEEAESA